MRATIRLTGEPYGTKIISDDGTDLSSLAQELRIIHRAGEMPVAEVVIGVRAEEIRDIPVRLVDFRGREIRRIEYADGEALDFGPKDMARIARSFADDPPKR